MPITPEQRAEVVEWATQEISGNYGSAYLARDILAFDAALALALEPEEIMVRRGWGVVKTTQGWQVVETRPGAVNGVYSMILKSTPGEALRETDKWCKENIDGK